MWRNAYDVIRQVIDEFGEKNAGLISAGVVFYGLFAIFPGIAATISLFGLFADPTVVDSQLELMRGLMPPGVFRLFEAQFDGLLNAGTATLGLTTLVSIGLALFSARTGVAALIRGLNAIFDRPNRGSPRSKFAPVCRRMWNCTQGRRLYRNTSPSRPTGPKMHCASLRGHKIFQEFWLTAGVVETE